MLKISLIQMNMIYNQPDSNFEKAKMLIKQAAQENCDVIVLPEMWNTGFIPKSDFEKVCDNDTQRVKEEIGSLAKEYSVNIVAGSVANIKNGKRYNTACVFNRSGELIGEYDKINLFSPMDEHLYFEKGQVPCTFKLDSVKCGLIICYDIRFPELVSEVAKNSDVVFMVAQWPNVRTDQLEALANERAKENNVFFVCCNSCGTAEETVFGGKSLICDKNGNTLKIATENEEILQYEI